MAIKEEHKKDETKNGFAGLASMVSDVETVITHAATMKTESKSETHRPIQTKLKPEQQPYQAPSQPSRGPKIGKWLMGFGIVMVVIWFASEFESTAPPKKYDEAFIDEALARLRANRHLEDQSIDVMPNPIGNARLEPRATIQAIQRQLNELEYNAGKADGIIGAKTRAAIFAFQKNNNLLVDGIASEELLQKLYSTTSKKGQKSLEKKTELSATQKPSINLTGTGYLKGYKKLRTNGFSTVTIDNSRNSSPVSAKLFHNVGNKSEPVRVISIMPGDSFTLKNIQSGKYDVRYEVSNTGLIYKSDPFFLEEQSTETGIRYSDIRMTLYTVNNGNMQMKHISRSEFE